ncbi:MAG TPA: hypothetical protein VEW92_10340 [Nitrososphaeraceae archaeon]|nr:hypothetical protein [Nitrososphaeraceae archaeon]
MRYERGSLNSTVNITLYSPLTATSPCRDTAVELPMRFSMEVLPRFPIIE